MSNGVFNFNFLALILSEILRGSQIYSRGSYALWTPPSEDILLPKASTSISNCVFNFNILALTLSEILGVPHLRYGALCPPVRLLEENFLYPIRVLYYD